MAEKLKYKVVIVEDDALHAQELRTHINESDDFVVSRITDSATEAFRLVKTMLPDVMIVDLGLAEGDGVQLLEKIRTTSNELPIMPFLYVTTGNSSEVITDRVKDGLADFVVSKDNPSYSAEHIHSFLKIVAPKFQRNKKPELKALLSDADKETMLRARISTEFDYYYQKLSSTANEYMADALYEVFHLSDMRNFKSKDIAAIVAKKHRRTNSSVSKALERWIDRAFTETALEDLRNVFPKYVSTKYTKPSLKDFLYITAYKIQKENIY